MQPMADRKSSKPKKPKTARWQRIAMMDKEILDVEGAATLPGVSTTTIYNFARKGDIPATRVGREWRFARANLIQWVANGTAAQSSSWFPLHICGVQPTVSSRPRSAGP